ncbi:MAG: glycosyltransferase [Hespellia sp.]|nr:glycosyltransferase [Hespellia sp.]
MGYKGKNMEISILLTTYNHEKYVKQTLDSILMQKINAPYEIIVLDDGSSDQTPQILKEYKRKYPRHISLYLRKKNINYPTKNGYFSMSKAKGKYIAFIEGDDYWIDEYKIQKQYDFLEQNPKYSGCITDLIVVDENNNEISEQVYERKENSIYTLEDFRHLRGPGMAISFMARNYFDEEEYRIVYRAARFMADITIYMLCVLKGDIYQLDDKTAAYRYVCANGKGNFNSTQRENIYKNYMITEYWIKLENFMRQYDEKFEFIPMADTIKQIASQYSVRAGLNLINKSTKKGRYFWLYLMCKLLDTNYLLDTKNGKRGTQYSWSQFMREKKPIVLFGTGAVAREFLDKYAWRGNILFLVDNDKNKQNTSFKGFLVKKPEEIIRYKNKVKVLITNQLYEADIEKQLLSMGMKNYYCYCSMQTNRFRNMIANKWLRK